MKKKVLLLCVLVLASVMIISACGSNNGQGSTQNTGNATGASSNATGNETTNNEETSGDEAEDLFIPIISKGFQHQFWQAVKAGAEQAAEEFGVTITFEGPETEAQVDKQIDMLRTALDRNPDAIGFAALDSQAAIPYLREAQDKNIPIVAFDSGVDSDIPVTTASTNNLAAAELAAVKMAELIGNEGKIAIIAHDQTSVTGKQREEGFSNKIKSDFPDIEIVSIQIGGGDHLKSTDLAKAIMQANPDLKGIYGTNEGSAIGVVNAVTEMNNTDVVVVGFDSGKQQIDAIRDGRMAGAITQNPVGIGYGTVRAAVMAIRGETLPSTIDTGFYWYDQSNIDNEEIQAVIYE